MKYVDENGKKTESDSGQDKLLALLYTTAFGRLLLKPFVMPWFSKLAGVFLASPLSRCLISPFIRSHHIIMDDYIQKSWHSYNDFFTRKIKKGARPLPKDDNTLISPCDSYVSAYRINEHTAFHVKNTMYTLPALLHSKRLAKQFQGGCALIFRLTVSDYHRYAYAVSGKQSKNYRIPGIFHTVNPIANDFFPIYHENTREFTVIHSRQFGKVVQMEVGALLVGKIVNHKESCPVSQGEEKGFFEFGGSTIILLLQKDAVSLRNDLFENTACGYETRLRLGAEIGHKPTHTA